MREAQSRTRASSTKPDARQSQNVPQRLKQNVRSTRPPRKPAERPLKLAEIHQTLGALTRTTPGMLQKDVGFNAQVAIALLDHPKGRSLLDLVIANYQREDRQDWLTQVLNYT